MRVTDLLGKVDAAGQYIIEPVPEHAFDNARARLLDEGGVEGVPVRLRPDAHIDALDPRLCGGIQAALHQLNGLNETGDKTIKRPRKIEAEGQVTVPLKVRARKTRRGRTLAPEVIKSVTFKRGQVKVVDIKIAYYLLGPDRWGLLFEEVDPDSLVYVDPTPAPGAGDDQADTSSTDDAGQADAKAEPPTRRKRGKSKGKSGS